MHRRFPRLAPGRARRAALGLLALALGALPAAARAACLDRAAWADLLERHTAPVSGLAGVAVDYAGLRSDPAWRPFVDALEACDPGTLSGRAETLAFWINAYNVLAIDLVVRFDPEDSIRDIGSLWSPVWKRAAGRIGGREISLDRIEHGILRPMGEPRIHGAIVCASRSCPPLRREPFAAARLDAQLDDQMRVFLADPRKGARLEDDGRRLRLSKVFDWFEEDFEAAGGVLAFVRPYLPFRVPGEPEIAYFDYDWSLNALSRDR